MQFFVTVFILLICLFLLQFEPYVQKGNEGFVHHMLVYECHDSFNDSHYGPGFDCRDQANMPFTKCYFYSIVAAWAIGGEVRSLSIVLEL